MLNTKLRTAAKNKFEKDSFKVINNSVFGKTMENIRNHKDKPSDKSSQENTCCRERITGIKMIKPGYFEQAILDLSKMIMYKFHHDYMHPKYGNKLMLCYMNTDSSIKIY